MSSGEAGSQRLDSLPMSLLQSLDLCIIETQSPNLHDKYIRKEVLSTKNHDNLSKNEFHLANYNLVINSTDIGRGIVINTKNHSIVAVTRLDTCKDFRLWQKGYVKLMDTMTNLLIGWLYRSQSSKSLYNHCYIKKIKGGA